MTSKKNLYPSFLFICLLLILFALFKKKNYILFANNEPFIGSDIKDALNTYTMVNKKEYNKLKAKKETFDASPIDAPEINNLVTKQVREAIKNIPAVKGSTGPRGLMGYSGGAFQSKGALAASSLALNGTPTRTVHALAPVGISTTTPVIFGEPNLNTTTEWTHTADGSIINNSLKPKTLCMRYSDKSSDLGRNKLLELTSTDNCTKFTADNHNRLTLNNSNNQCVTVTKKSNIPVSIQIPRTNSYCDAETLDSKTNTCVLDNEVYLLGVDTCKNSVSADQVFRFT